MCMKNLQQPEVVRAAANTSRGFTAGAKHCWGWLCLPPEDIADHCVEPVIFIALVVEVECQVSIELQVYVHIEP